MTGPPPPPNGRPPPPPGGGPPAPPGGGPPAPPPGAVYGPTGAYAPRNEPLAIGALICSVMGLVACVLVAPVGIVMGFKARSRIAKSNGMLTGDGLAIASIAIGFAAVIVNGLSLAFVLFFMLTPPGI